MFEYVLSKSFEEMKAVIEIAENDLNNEELKKEVNYRIGNFLHSLFDYYERIEKQAGIQIDRLDIKFFSGLRYANNKLKHDPSVLQVYQRTGGFSFPMSFPLSIETIVFRWNDIVEEKNPKYIKQHDNYILNIQGKEIMQISEDALKRLKSANNIINQ